MSLSLISLLFLGAFASTDFPISSQFYSVDASKTISVGTNGIAYGSINSDVFTTSGWYKLVLTTRATYTDQQQAYFAGFLEGYLTNFQIYQSYQTWVASSGQLVNSPQIQKFVMTQYQFMKNSILSNSTDYWAHVSLSLSQLEGLYDGYNANCTSENKIKWLNFLLFQMQDELGDILTSFSQKDSPAQNRTQFESHCSVLVRLTSDGQTLLASHDTWSTFNTMLRIYKYYTLRFKNPKTRATTIGFSGYPGTLVSGDDYYTTTPSNLVIMETTNEVFDQSLFQNFVKPSTVPFWVRIAVANRMSQSGKEWAQIFGTLNSGTYNNQYQIVDYKRFTPGQRPTTDLLWIIEQIPGFVVSADMTSTLATQGFWPSYNIPFFPFIYDTSGYPIQYKLNGNEYSYTMCARAQIFRRDAGKVENMDDMKRIMRYNNYQNDPLSLQDACKQISARCDLNTPWAQNTLNGFSAFGAIDCKITDNRLLKSQSSNIICGPTWDDQPPFAWTKQWVSAGPHYGTPNLFAFDFYQVSMSA